MRVENRPVGQTSYGVSRGTETKQSGKFSDALAAQTARARTDTLEISSSAADAVQEKSIPGADAAREQPVKAAPDFLPTDPIERKLWEAEHMGISHLLDLFYREVSEGKADLALSETAVAYDTYLPSKPSDIQVKLKELREAAANTDYSEMSYKEIYTAIWNRYNDVFDGNMPAITSGFGPPEWCQIGNQFHREVTFLVEYPIRRKVKQDTGLEPGDEGYAEYRRSRFGDLSYAALCGYEGMSVEEREQAILEKYAGRDTLLDFLNMQGELYRTGVLSARIGSDAAFHYMGAMSREVSYTYFMDEMLDNVPMDQWSWDTALYGKFDVHSFAASLKERMRNATFSGFDFDVAGAVTKGIDDLLAALERRDAEQIS